MSQALPFGPLGKTVTVAAGLNASGASTTLPGTGGDSIKIINSNTTPITFAVSSTPGGAVAAANDTMVNTGLTEIHGMPANITDVACFGVGAAGNVVVQRGSGM